MRELTSHKVNGVNDELKVLVLDEPGHGGANHKYAICTKNKPLKQELRQPGVQCDIEFQNGTIPEAGTNGVTHETLLAVLIDRLEGFQSGKFACEANQSALDHLKAAQEALLGRTRERLSRSVEGTHKV